MAKLRPLLLVALAALAAACSTSPKRLPNAAYYLGETYLRRGQLQQAVEAYRVFIVDPGEQPDIYLPRAYYMLAFAYYRQGNYADALATLDELEQRYPAMDSVQVWTLRGDTSRALGHRVQAVQEYDEAWRFAGQLDRVRLESRITGTLKEMNVEELTQAEQLVSDPSLHRLTTRYLVDAGGSVIEADDQAAIADEDAALAAAPPSGAAIKRSHERREAREQEIERKRARRDSEAAARLEAPPPQEEVPAAALAPEPLAIEAVPREPGKIVCLAPLSGPESSIGQKVCDSVTSAFGDSSGRVLTQDAGETSNAARAAWMTAIEDPSVLAAVAWLPRDATQAVAPLAETAGVPMVLVSSASGNEGRYVREWGPGRSSEVNTLARYMVNTVRMRRFGVLYPDTEAGNDYLDRFSAAVRADGGDVVGKQYYRAGQGTWSGVLDALKKWRSRDLNVDAVFVPDQLGNVAALVAEINREYPDIIVLGLSSWNGTTEPLRAFVASGSDSAAFDAASALYGAVVGGGANTRSSVEERLRHVDTAATASTSPPTIIRLQNGTSEAVGG